MKIKILSVVTMMSCSTFLFAQDTSHLDRSEKIQEWLELTDEQTDKVRLIMDEHRATMEDIHAERKALRDRMDDAREKHKTALQNILSPEQYEKFQEHMKKNRKRYMHSDSLSHIPNKRQEILELTDRQDKALRRLDNEFTSAIKQLKESDITGEQKSKEIRKLKNEHEQAVEEILDEDQFQKWKEWKMERQQNRVHRSNRRQKIGRN